MDESSQRRRDPPLHGLSDRRAPGLEQEHSFRPFDRDKFRRLIRCRSRLGPARAGGIAALDLRRRRTDTRSFAATSWQQGTTS